MLKRSPRKGSHSYQAFVSEFGIISEVVEQCCEWRVEYRSSYWTAHSQQPVEFNPGDVVRVIGRDNITLIIESADQTPK
jgi:membrane protein implicated in regulation of membrane protease activity